jgi:mono/diheme cytochrome c family protein
MKNKFLWLCSLGILALLAACNNDTQTADDVTVHQSSKSVIPPPADNTGSDYDAQKGVGAFTNVTVSAVPDEKKAATGKLLFESVCSSCHRLTEDAIGGPGLKNVTKNFKPEWILNVITNTTKMMQVDPRLKSKAEFYQVQMPQLGLSDEQALSVYEYLRKADTKN